MLQKTITKTRDVKVTAPTTPAIISNRLMSDMSPKTNTYIIPKNIMFVICLPGVGSMLIGVLTRIELEILVEAVLGVLAILVEAVLGVLAILVEVVLGVLAILVEAVLGVLAILVEAVLGVLTKDMLGILTTAVLRV